MIGISRSKLQYGSILRAATAPAVKNGYLHGVRMNLFVN